MILWIISSERTLNRFRNEQTQPWKQSVTARNLDTRDLSRVGVASPPPDVKEIRVQKKEESWDWLNN